MSLQYFINIINNTATEFINTDKKKNSLQKTVLPDKYLNSLDKKYFINTSRRIYFLHIIELFVYHILLFLFVIIILYITISPLFHTKKLKDVINIFLISVVPSIYSYMNTNNSWNHYVIGNIISAFVAYFVIKYLKKYLHYIILQTIIIIGSFMFMILFNSIDITGLTYGLIGYDLVDKIGYDGYVNKWIIYVIVSFIILKIILYLNDVLFTYINNMK